MLMKALNKGVNRLKIIIPLAEGFEEIEAVTCIDVLRRGGIEVVTVALDSLDVKGAHNIIIRADTSISSINYSKFDGILLPGGMPGATTLRDDERVIKLIQELAKGEKLIAAICAAPIALEQAGILTNKKATSYPGFDKEMVSCNYQNDRVVVDNNIITGRGPGVALEFALNIVSYLVGETKVEELEKGMLVVW